MDEEENKINKVIPVRFEQLEAIDSRFTRVKIWLMHLGENLNGSVFAKDVVELAFPTLANNPILGYIENNSDGEEDFSDHRNVLSKKNGEWGWRYQGSAYGVIPESHNAQWEMRTGDDGIEREYLTVEGLMWTKWDSSIDIMNRDVAKAQSMELTDDYEGYFDKDKKFHFTKFSFYGACILGKDVKPAMQNASVELFSANDISSQVKFHLAEFEKIMMTKHQEDTNVSSEGGNEVDKKLELLAKYGVTVDQLDIKIDDTDLVALEEAAKKFVASLQNNTEATKGEGDVTPVDKVIPVVEPERKEDFASTAGQIRNEIRTQLKEDGGITTDEWGFIVPNFYYVDHTDTEVIAESTQDNWQLVGLSYTMNGDIPTINFDSKRRLKIQYVPLEGDNTEGTPAFSVVSNDRKAYDEQVTKAKFNKEMDILKGQLVSVQGEVEQLNEFKNAKLTEERKDSIDGVFADKRFSQLTEEEVSEFKTECYTSKKSVEEIAEVLFSMLGKKFAAKFSAPVVTGNKTLKVALEPVHASNSKPYDGLIARFKNK